jgi:SAM-dependent methyltransferase
VKSQRDELLAAVEGIQSTRAYKLLRLLGRWKFIAQGVAQSHTESPGTASMSNTAEVMRIDADCYRIHDQHKKDECSSMNDKGAAELAFWLTVWAPRIRERGHWEDHTILGVDGDRIGTYEEQRRKEARARALRTPVLVGLPPTYLEGKVVVDIGPGTICMLEMSGAAEAYAIEPLADQYRQHGLLIDGDTPVTYFATGAEQIPLSSGYADVVVAFNSLDHVDDVSAAAREIHRVLRSGGVLLLNVELDHAPTEAEPHSLTEADVGALFPGYDRQYCRIAQADEAGEELTHGSRWLMACLVRP